MRQPVHGTVVALRCKGQWRGVMICGPSGAGKSDLALRLMAMGARLVVDDQAIVWTNNGCIYARAPQTISGKIEVRGVGILPASPLAFVRLSLIVQAQLETPERLPDQQFTELEGVRVPSMGLRLLHPSAPHVVASALEAL